jgi:chloramphenicol 3-O phosphotransferase
MLRRNTDQAGRGSTYVVGTPGNPIPEPIRRWQEEVHRHGDYDLEVDTSAMSPAECAAAIRIHLPVEPGFGAFTRIAGRS